LHCSTLPPGINQFAVKKNNKNSSRIKFTKSVASREGNVSEPRLSQVGRVLVWSVCFCSHSCGDASIRLLTQQLQSHDWGTRVLRFVRLVLNVVVQSDGDFVDLILL